MGYRKEHSYLFVRIYPMNNIWFSRTFGSPAQPDPSAVMAIPNPFSFGRKGLIGKSDEHTIKV